jgi:hypothetical protein
MSASKKELGTIQAVLNRLNEERIPRALRLHSKVKSGERLSDQDMVFLQRVLEEANSMRSLVAEQPQYQPLLTRLTALYSGIVTAGLENEKNTARV